jgi:hypothetical protein
MVGGSLRLLSLASHEVFLNFTTWIQSIAMFNDVTSDKLKTVLEWSFLIVLSKISLFFAEYCHGVKNPWLNVHKSTAAMNYFFSNMTNNVICMTLGDLRIRHTITLFTCTYTNMRWKRTYLNNQYSYSYVKGAKRNCRCVADSKVATDIYWLTIYRPSY